MHVPKYPPQTDASLWRDSSLLIRSSSDAFGTIVVQRRESRSHILREVPSGTSLRDGMEHISVRALCVVINTMQPLWKIDYYESRAGNKPVEEFINLLEEKAQVKITRTLELLEEFGIRTGPPHVKKLIGTSLWELRILGSDSLRILYIARNSGVFFWSMRSKRKHRRQRKKKLS